MNVDDMAERMADTEEELPLLPDTQHVFVFTGLPGSGKSTAAEFAEQTLKSHYEWAVTAEVSDFVREQFERQTGGTVNDNELGRWAAEQKEEYGNGYFVDAMAAEHQDHGRHVCISGVRSPAEYDALVSRFGADRVTMIGVWTTPDERFRRKYGDRVSSDHPKYDEFVERKERELWDWGCIEFFDEDSQHAADYVLDNNVSISAFEGDVRETVVGVVEGEDIEGFDHPFPEGIDQEQIAQYL